MTDTPETVKAYAEWPCLICGVVATSWVLKPHGPNLGAYCPDCGGRCGSPSSWVNKKAAGLEQRSIRSGNFEPSQRFQIMARDGHKCWLCNRGRQQDVFLTVDHIVPVDRGGPPEIENGLTLCEECNSGKRALFDVELTIKALIHTHIKPSDKADDTLISVWKVMKRVAQTLKAWRVQNVA